MRTDLVDCLLVGSKRMNKGEDSKTVYRNEIKEGTTQLIFRCTNLVNQYRVIAIQLPPVIYMLVQKLYASFFSVDLESNLKISSDVGIQCR